MLCETMARARHTQVVLDIKPTRERFAIQINSLTLRTILLVITDLFLVLQCWPRCIIRNTV